MLTKEDYKDYLEQMMDIEKQSVEIYSKYLSIADNSTFKEEIEKIYLDEIEHVKIVQKITELLSS